MKTRTSGTARTRRARARGAAMVEAVIVLSTMLVFMGLIVYMRKAYGTKLDLQQSTRAEALYYASHACSGSSGRATSEPSPIASDGSDEVENAAGKSSVPNKAAASRTWNTATANATGTVSWFTVWDVNAATGAGRSINLQRSPLNRTVKGESAVTCNEKKYDSPWTAWFSFAVDFAAGFGGAQGLFL